MRSLRSRLFVAASIVLLGACAAPPLKMPPPCSPIQPAEGDPPQAQIVCAGGTYPFPDAAQFQCYLPQDLAPCLDRCLK